MKRIYSSLLIRIVAASDFRIANEYPDTIRQIGSPSGAFAVNWIGEPGKQPISSNFSDIS
ncbi:hypothetical protein GCM10027190_46020 [Spirosoma areae]